MENKADKTKKPFYKTWWGLLFLMPISLSVLTWKSSKLGKGAKIGIIFIIWFFTLLFGSSGGSKTAKEGFNKGLNTAEEMVKENEKSDTNIETKEVTLNSEEKIRQVLNDKFGGNNNRDVPYLKEIKINENALESTPDFPIYNVSVFFNADDNLGEKMLKMGMKSDIAKIYKILYTNDLPIFDVWVFAHFPMTDKYGNTIDSLVHKSNLTKETAEKVNWDMDDATLRLQILPKVWETHKSLID